MLYKVLFEEQSLYLWHKRRLHREAALRTLFTHLAFACQILLETDNVSPNKVSIGIIRRWRKHLIHVRRKPGDTETDTDTQRQTQTHRDKHRHTQRQRQTHTETDTDRGGRFRESQSRERERREIERSRQ